MGKRIVEVAAGLFIPVLVVLFMVGCDDTKDDGAVEHDSTATSGEMSIDGPDASNMAARGEYLVTVLGCNDCHTAKSMGPDGMPVLDQAHLLAGHVASQPLGSYDKKMVGMGPDNWVLMNMTMTAYIGPWGTTYAANLTPDATGLKGWTAEQFMKALREGKYKGMDNTRPIMPPMPWEAYGKLSDNDLKAIFAYLQSIPPVENNVPAYAPPDGAPPGGAPAPAPGDSAVAAPADSGA